MKDNTYMELDWTAHMIAPQAELGSAPRLHGEFELERDHGGVRSAHLRATALGVFEARLNGARVSDEVLSPGWSSYQWRLRFAEYDVTDLVADTNHLDIVVGNGWYRGRLTWTGKRALYGADRGASAELRIVHADGYVQRVRTDESWIAFPSDVLEDDLYDGQTIDARVRKAGAPLNPHPVTRLDFDPALIQPMRTPPIRRQQELAVQSLLSSEPGRILLDFGQNIVGWLRLRVHGPRSTEVVVRHAEVLEDGGIALRPLRSAEATDRFILSGGADEFEPSFTFHGFRYAEITGWPGDFDPDAVSAIVVHSDMARTGTFSCSDPLLNRLHENVVWGMRGNFVGIPTDCPQRDERLGWTGDIAVFGPTAAFLYDVEDFLGDWLVDLALEQQHNHGVVPSVVPDVIGDIEVPYAESIGTTAIWSDAAVWVPWSLWIAYGNRADLESAYPSMVVHARSVASSLSDTFLWDTGFQYGDWLDPDASPHRPWESKADTAVVATACAFRTLHLAAESAAVLGRSDDEAEFRRLASLVRTAFHDHYVNGGRVRSDATTVYTLAIVFDLLSESDLETAGQRLAELVEASDYRISTGFAGTPFICDALTRTGHLDAAYRLLLQRELPSWLYAVTMGATTIWERWDSMLPDGSVNPGEMTSFNHYALGSVADWMHRTIAGLSPLEPGYSSVLVAPRPGGGITHASATLLTSAGEIAIEWAIVSGQFELSVRLPVGTNGFAELPDGSRVALQSGVQVLTSAISPESWEAPLPA